MLNVGGDAIDHVSTAWWSFPTSKPIQNSIMESIIELTTRAGCVLCCVCVSNVVSFVRERASASENYYYYLQHHPSMMILMHAGPHTLKRTNYQQGKSNFISCRPLSLQYALLDGIKALTLHYSICHHP